MNTLILILISFAVFVLLCTAIVMAALWSAHRSAPWLRCDGDREFIDYDTAK